MTPTISWDSVHINNFTNSFISFLQCRVLRETQESKILVNFAGSLIPLYFVTMLGYGDMPEGACHLWAFLMVYFFIVALFWGFLEALLVMLKLKISNFEDRFLTRNYVWIAMPLAWGMYISIKMLKEHLITSVSLQRFQWFLLLFHLVDWTTMERKDCKLL